MMQDDISQRRVVMRGAMDTCCSLWASVVPPVSVVTPILAVGSVDAGNTPVQDEDADIPDSTRK